MAVATIEAHRWKREEYERLAAQGFFPPGQRVELVEGIIYDMAPQNSHHATAFPADPGGSAGSLSHGFQP